MKERTKKFILGMTGYSLFILVAKAALAGLIQATAAFLADAVTSTLNDVLA